MKTLKTLKHIIFSFAFVLALGLMMSAGTDAKAATTTVTETKQWTPAVKSVGDSVSLEGANIKINGKAIKKSRKKVRAILTNTNPEAYYIPASHYSRAYYNSVADYEKAQQKDSYKVKNYYTFVFKKAGTYTFTWDEYDCIYTWKPVAGQAYSVKDVEITKTTYTYKVKVVKDTNVFKYVKLGKAKVTNSAKRSETSSSSTYVSNRYLTGTSGKLNIKTNSTYEITSIVVMTYDKDGNQVYCNVGNKQTIAYGLNAYDSTLYNVVPGVDNNKKSFSRQLMKRTYVYVGYRNKHTGEYTKFAAKADPTTKKTYFEVEYQQPGVDYEGKPYELRKNTYYGPLSTALSWYARPEYDYSAKCCQTFIFKLK